MWIAVFSHEDLPCWNRPPRRSSSSAAKIDGESNRGKQKKLMEPSTQTRAAVRRLPIAPQVSMGA